MERNCEYGFQAPLRAVVDTGACEPKGRGIPGSAPMVCNEFPYNMAGLFPPGLLSGPLGELLVVWFLIMAVVLCYSVWMLTRRWILKPIG